MALNDKGSNNNFQAGSGGQPPKAAEGWHEPVELKYVVGERELKEARLAAEEAQRAWREEHDARVEAEEVKAAVVKAAEDAMAEAAEMKNKLSKEIEEARQKGLEAQQARRLYEEAKAQTDEAKRIWREAFQTRLSGRSDDKLVIQAQQAEQRAAYIIKWVE